MMLSWCKYNKILLFLLLFSVFLLLPFVLFSLLLPTLLLLRFLPPCLLLLHLMTSAKIHVPVFLYRNRKLEMSTARTKAKSREQALVQNKIDWQKVRSRDRQAGSQTDMVDGVWS